MNDKLREALEAAEVGLANMVSYQSSGNTPSISEYGQSRRALDAVRSALASDDAARGTMREQFEAWCVRNGYPTDYTPGAECGVEGGPVYRDTRTHAAWWAYREGQASRAAAPQSVEPYGCVTTQTHTGQQVFYRWPRPPYLDNASECVMVYLAPPTAPTDAEWLEEAMRLADEIRFSEAPLAALRVLRAHLSTRPAQADEADRLDAERGALLEEARDALCCMQWSAVSSPSCQFGAVKRCSCRRCAGAFARTVLEKLDAAVSAPPTNTKEQGS